MLKIFYLIVIILIYSCSIDRNTNFWEKKTNNIVKSSSKSLNFSENLPFDKFKKNIIDYGNESNFPKLDLK